MKQIPLPIWAGMQQFRNWGAVEHFVLCNVAIGNSVCVPVAFPRGLTLDRWITATRTSKFDVLSEGDAKFAGDPVMKWDKLGRLAA